MDLEPEPGKKRIIDYELEYLQTWLESGSVNGLSLWKAEFDTAIDDWKIDKVRKLLKLAKAQTLSLDQQSIVRHSEGTLLDKLGEWEEARNAYGQALLTLRTRQDFRGELVVVNSLANLLRRMDRPLSEVIQIYETALKIAEGLGDEEGCVALLNGIGLAYYAQGKLEAAREFFQQV